MSFMYIYTPRSLPLFSNTHTHTHSLSPLFLSRFSPPPHLSTPHTRQCPYGLLPVPSSTFFTITAFLPAYRPVSRITTFPGFKKRGIAPSLSLSRSSSRSSPSRGLPDMKLSIPLKMIRTPRTNQFIMRNSRCIGYFSRASLGFRVLIEVIDLSARRARAEREGGTRTGGGTS